MFPTTIRRIGQSTGLSPFSAIDEDFDRLFSPWIGDNSDVEMAGTCPVDISEDDEHVYIEAELPGFAKDQVEITFENSVLSIIAQRKKGEEKKGQKHLAERRFTRMARSFKLPNTVDESNIHAKLTDGVLHLKLNKRDEVKPRRIAVN